MTTLFLEQLWIHPGLIIIVRPIGLMVLHGNWFIWIPESNTAKNKVCKDVIFIFNDILKVSCTLLIGYFMKHIIKLELLSLYSVVHLFQNYVQQFLTEVSI